MEDGAGVGGAEVEEIGLQDHRRERPVGEAGVVPADHSRERE